MLTKKDEETVTNIVVDAIKDVAMPVFEQIYNQFTKIEIRLNSIETRTEQIDRKLDVFSAKTIAGEAKLDDHEERLKQLEASLTI